MKISKDTASFDNREHPEHTFRLLKECGYDAADYSGACCRKVFEGVRTYELPEKEFISYFKKVKSAANKYGIEIAQTHSTFENLFPAGEAGEYEKHCIKKCLEASAILESPIMVVHPLSPKSFEEETPEERKSTLELNKIFFTELIELAQKYNVKLALENMPGPKALTGSAEYLIEYVDMMQSDIFGACLDTGHAFCSGHDCAEMARKLGDRIICLHVHNNQGLNPNFFDEHLPMYLGRINWDDFFLALKDIGYNGTFNLENEWYQLPQELIADACRIDAKFAKYYIGKYNL